ncbi:MAG: hypothetical protein ABI835_19745, partial [Chloroflexota bacterium]
MFAAYEPPSPSPVAHRLVQRMSRAATHKQTARRHGMKPCTGCRYFYHPEVYYTSPLAVNQIMERIITDAALLFSVGVRACPVSAARA